MCKNIYKRNILVEIAKYFKVFKYATRWEEKGTKISIKKVMSEINNIYIYMND